MATVERVVARQAEPDGTVATLTVIYDDTPVSIGGGNDGFVATAIRVSNPTDWGFWVGVRQTPPGTRTAQQIFSPQLTEEFNLPQGQASRFWFTVRVGPKPALEGLIFQSAFVPWTGARTIPNWP